VESYNSCTMIPTSSSKTTASAQDARLKGAHPASSAGESEPVSAPAKKRAAARRTVAAERRESSAAERAAPARSRGRAPGGIAAEARLLPVGPGLHRLVIPASRVAARDVAGLTLPAVFVAAPPSRTGDAVQLIGAHDGGIWIDAAGGAVTLRAPATGGHVLVTGYSAPEAAAIPLDIELHPVDAVVVPTAPGSPPLRTAVILHIEREGDCQFTTGGWAGRLGSRRRVEALAVRPLEVISSGEIEYKVFSTGGRETPWVSDGRLCGTRGQGLPLTGFAIRLAPPLRNRFDVIYRGAFFASGPAPAASNGEACFAPLRDDPLEAVEIRLIERQSSR